MNAPTFAVLAVLLLCLALAVRSIWKGRGAGCSCGCGTSCPHSTRERSCCDQSCGHGSFADGGERL